MLRQMRMEYPGAIYHVMSRGDQREPVFLDGGIGPISSRPWATPARLAESK
jgi:hypothetical protein